MVAISPKLITYPIKTIFFTGFCYMFWFYLSGYEDLPQVGKTVAMIYFVALFFAGVFGRGKTNTRLIILHAFGYIAAVGVYVLSFVYYDNNTYVRALTPVFSLVFGYMVFLYYNWIQVKVSNLLEFCRVPDKYRKAIVGDIEQTNLLFLMIKFWGYYVVLDFTYCAIVTCFGLYYGVPIFDSSISSTMTDLQWTIVYTAYNGGELVIDFLMAVKLIQLTIVDIRWPDALGVGQNRVWKQSAKA